MPYAEVPAFIAHLREREAIAARALEFTILAATRSGETLGMTWAELDLNANLWIVPGARMKSGREHRIPLSDQGADIVRKTVLVCVVFAVVLLSLEVRTCRIGSDGATPEAGPRFLPFGQSSPFQERGYES